MTTETMRAERSFALTDLLERAWWDMPWWVRSPALLATLWLSLVALCLVGFCLVMNGIVQRSQERQWAVSEHARYEWQCIAARRSADNPACAALQVSRND